MTLYLTYTTWKRKKYRIAAYTVSQRISLSEHKWVNLSERYSRRAISQILKKETLYQVRVNIS